MHATAAALTTVAVAASLASARTFTVTNHCSYTVWPGLFSDPKSPVPTQATGWQLDPGQTTSFNMPANWSGRIWGRNDCDFSKPGPNNCATGGCNSQAGNNMQCATTGGTGVPPATVAEWTLDTPSGDNYDVSNVDGFNIPMTVTNSVGCPTPSCPKDLNPGCPDDRLKVKDSQGNTVGCKTACTAGIDDVSANCCTGPAHNTSATCPSSGVEFYSYFKGNCPNAYAYAYDESSGTALWTCPSSKQADYTLTFC